jgi:hypothetical protein
MLHLLRCRKIATVLDVVTSMLRTAGCPLKIRFFGLLVISVVTADFAVSWRRREDQDDQLKNLSADAERGPRTSRTGCYLDMLTRFSYLSRCRLTSRLDPWLMTHIGPRDRVPRRVHRDHGAAS